MNSGQRDAIDPAVWQRPEMRAALAARDVATIYRRLQRVGVSQRRIAALTGQSQSEISEILGGRKVSSYDVLTRMADGLGVPRGWLGLAYDDTDLAISGERLSDGGVVDQQYAESLCLDLLQRTPTSPAVGVPSEAAPSASLLAQELQKVDPNELAQVIVVWLQQFNPTIGRRNLLAKLGAVIALAGAAPLFDVVDPDERERVIRVLHDPRRLDAATLGHYEALVTSLRRQGDLLGPRTTLQTVLAHRHLVGGLAAAAPGELRPRTLSLYAEMSQLVGWSLFNLGDYQNAIYYYDDARTAAHDAHNVDLVTYVLCTMSHLLTWQGKPRVGIDHAVAAAAWANQIDSPHARAYAADVAVRAYLADDQHEACEAALAEEYAAIRSLDPQAASSGWWYFLDEAFYWRTEAEVALKRRQADAAMGAIDKSLNLIDPANVHNHAFRLLFRAEAYIQQGHVTEATTIVGDVAGLAAVNSTKRLDERINALRGDLTKWESTQPVRDLDERLLAYRGAADFGSTRTKRTYSR